tara:strand:- start:784 stop:966 length:183 start_codon:yes stop_codon:yes gene_type:complete
MKLLETLVKDEKMNDQVLYSSGPYWDYKNKRTLNEIKKRELRILEAYLLELALHLQIIKF